MQSDEMLFQAYRTRGDEDAFRQLYDRHINYIRRICGRYARGHVDVVNDLAQTTFEQFHAARDKLRRTDKCVAYLLAVCENVCNQYQRANARFKRNTNRCVCLSDTMLTTQCSDDHQQSDVEIQDLLNWLPDMQRTALQLICFEGYTIDEAAAATGIKHTTCQWRFQDALKRLHKLLGDPV